MRDFSTYSPEGVIAENLGELTERFDALGEQEIAHLRELAAELAQSDDISDLLSSLPYYRISYTTPPTNALQENVELLSRSHSLLGAKQCMILCRALCQALADRGPLLPALFPDFEEVSPLAAGRIVYQRSSYTNNAYLAFATLVPAARATYAHSFHAACEQVYNGHCEYCILPLENAAEGELIGFAKLIMHSGLKIVATCDIAETDASRKTRFALLRRNLLPLIASSTEKEGSFRCSLPMYLESSLGDILSAASFFGLSLHSASTVPSDKEEAPSCCNLTFDICGGDLSSFLLYLAMVAPQYTPIGIYPHIKLKG